MENIISDTELKHLVKQSINECYEKDKELISKSMEQASVARIFYYMQRIIDTNASYAKLRRLNVDCEYNKNENHIKQTPNFDHGIRPDLVIHKRGNNNHNLLVIEFKPANDSDLQRDKEKLEDLTHPDIYGYQLGISIKLNEKEPHYIYFKNGKRMSRLLT